MKLCPLSFFAIENGLLPFCSSHLSLKLHGDKTRRTTPLAKNVMLQDLKYLRMARKAGVQRMASPIGEGSQTKISPPLLRFPSGVTVEGPCDSLCGICDSEFALHIAIFARALYRKLVT